MKKLLTFLAPGLLVMSLLTSCSTNQQQGDGAKAESVRPSVGQQLMELQKARDNGSLTDAEYQAEKNRLLQSNQN